MQWSKMVLIHKKRPKNHKIFWFTQTQNYSLVSQITTDSQFFLSKNQDICALFCCKNHNMCALDFINLRQWGVTILWSFPHKIDYLEFKIWFPFYQQWTVDNRWLVNNSNSFQMGKSHTEGHLPDEGQFWPSVRSSFDQLLDGQNSSSQN